MATAAQHAPANAGGERQPFGRWLLSQSGEPGMIGQLGGAASADRTFPKDGTPDQVRTHLLKVQADGDAFAAWEDAVMAWPE